LLAFENIVFVFAVGFMVMAIEAFDVVACVVLLVVVGSWWW